MEAAHSFLQSDSLTLRVKAVQVGLRRASFGLLLRFYIDSPSFFNFFDQANLDIHDMLNIWLAFLQTPLDP